MSLAEVNRLRKLQRTMAVLLITADVAADVAATRVIMQPIRAVSAVLL